MNFKPRDYQQKCRDNIVELLKRNVCDLKDLKMDGMSFSTKGDPERRVRKVMAVGPPGIGKGDLIAWLAYRAWSSGGSPLIWVHREELWEDLGSRLVKKFGVPAHQIGWIASGKKENRRARIQIASVMTKIRRETDWMNPTVVLTDEAHRLLSPAQLSLLERYPNAPVVSFTATPFRLSRKVQFDEVVDALVQITTYMEMVDKKFLLPTKVYAPAGTASLDGVKIRMGEYVQSDLEKAYMEERLYAALFNEWKRVTGGKMQTMVFNVSKKHNNAVNAFFKKMGVSCAAIDDSTPKAERKRIIQKFQEGPFVKDPIHMINSIMVFTDGLDAPYCKCSILNYSSKSATKYFQSAMRAGRPVWNDDYSDWLRLEGGRYYKDKVTIIDLGGNTIRHGLIDSYDTFGFDLSGEQKKGVAPTKVCPDCRTVVYASQMKCPECGYQFPENEKKDTKKYLDEVGLQEIKSDHHWQKLILNMPQDRIWSAHAGYLRVIALVKGYQTQWCYHVLHDRGEIPWHDGSPEAWPRFWKWIEGQEKLKGMADIYSRMKSRQIKK